MNIPILKVGVDDGADGLNILIFKVDIDEGAVNDSCDGILDGILDGTLDDFDVAILLPDGALLALTEGATGAEDVLGIGIDVSSAL